MGDRLAHLLRQCAERLLKRPVRRRGIYLTSDAELRRVIRATPSSADQED